MPRIILATGRCLGEDFDDLRLDTLFLTTPIAWKGTLAQYVERELESLRQARVRELAVLDIDQLHRLPDLNSPL